MTIKPECYLPGREIPEVFSGVPSFLGLPLAKTPGDLAGYHFAVLGAPWEGACTLGSFTGCENATKSVRKASTRYCGYLPEYDFDIFDHFTGCDYGDIAVRNGDAGFTFAQARKGMADIVAAGAVPIVFGGDHSLSLPLIEAFAEKHDGKIGILHFDAHMDNMDTFGDDRYARCCPFNRLYDMAGFDPKNLVSIGIRGPRNHYAALKTAKEAGASVITTLEVKRSGYMAAIQKAVEIAKNGTKAIYISVCSDALDVACNPGGPPDPCGLSSFELSQMLYHAGLAGASGFDFMEVYPPDDLHGISSHVACWMALYAMNGMAQKMLEERS
jgi:agmatinase